MLGMDVSPLTPPKLCVAMSTKKPRKKLFVSRAIQGRLLVKLAVYWGVYHVVLWHAMFMYRYFQYRADVLGGAPHVPFGVLYNSFVAQHYSMMMCAVAVFPIILWDMVKVTHRIAGPLVRFRRVLQDLARGQHVGEIRLRKGDMLVELQDAFNEYLRSLDADAKSGAAAVASVEEQLERNIIADLQEISGELSAETETHESEERAATISPVSMLS
jgi:hypothetical protein